MKRRVCLQSRKGQRPVSTIVTVRNRCDAMLIGARFRPMIDEAIAVYRELFGERVIDVRLQGSVARGEAVVGRSDLDVMALLVEAPKPHELECLSGRAEELGRRYPVVSRIELDAVAVEQLTHFQRFVLSSDAISVAGTDRLTRRAQRRERRALARLVTPDVAFMVEDYRALMAEVAADSEAVRFYGRIVAKDLLKGARGLVLLRGGPYEVSVPRMAQQVAEHVPELAGPAGRLAAIYRQPLEDARLVVRAIDEAATVVLPLWQAEWR